MLAAMPSLSTSIRFGFLSLLHLVLLFGTHSALAEAKASAPLLPRGLITKEAGVAPGYVLFGPILSDRTYLIDNDGRVIHEWKSAYSGSGGYLLPNGNLLRTGRDPDALHFRAGGVSGIVQEIAWDGTVVWEWRLSDRNKILHHDIAPLPNGNILAIAWEVKTQQEALRVGRRADTVPEQGLHPDFVLEIRPLPPDDASIVWEWHVWDHLVQNQDPKAPDYGEPAEHPGRLDINALAAAPNLSAKELERLKALGYMPPDAKLQDLDSDFLHINSIDYNATLDQFVLSVPELGEIWIVDHSTTTAKARGSSGGRAGRGGDLLYRWGNPAVYGRGVLSSQRLFYQHDARWIPDGFPGAGDLTIFNNGRNRTDGGPSTVEQIAAPLRSDGRYTLESGKAYGPTALAWSWALPLDRFAPFISGAERQPNGNTLVCSGPGGILLEVSAEGRIVWEYRNPFSGDVRLADGSPPQPVGGEKPYAVFRASRIAPDHPALRDRKLMPIDPQPAWHSPALAPPSPG